MFFIVPENKASNTPVGSPTENPSVSPHSAKRQRLSPEADEVSGYYPKRTPKACDRCRLKKARCQWSRGKICDKCKRDGVICTTNRESKRGPKTPNAAYVQLVESQRDCLLRAIRRIAEDGLVTDQAAMAKTMQEFGIRTDASRNGLRSTPGDEQTSKPDTEDLSPETSETSETSELQAMFEDWNAANINFDKTGGGLTVIDSESFSAFESYFDSQPHTNAETASSRTSSAAEDVAIGMTYLPSMEAADWFLADDCAGDWSLPSAEAYLYGVTA